jgi:hypothetical protein
VDVSVVFIAFDFDAFKSSAGVAKTQVEKAFMADLNAALPIYLDAFDSALDKSGIAGHSIEVFFLPVPSVADMRDLFQAKIGWTA